MWIIYLCGREASWRTRLKRELGGKYSILEADEKDMPSETEGFAPSISSLDQYLGSHDQTVLSRLTKIEKADLLVANATEPSFEIAFQLFYGALLLKPILLFVEDKEIPRRELLFASPVANMVFPSLDELLTFLREMSVLPQARKIFIRNIFFDALQKEINEIFTREDRKDALFRSAILTTQIGQLSHYLTHDRAINPGARSVGSRADEEAQMGDCIVQLMIYSISRGFNIVDIYSIGIRRMGEAVWRSKQPEIPIRELRPEEIGYGVSASIGDVTGKVALIKSIEDAGKISEGPCIIAMPEYQKAIWEEVVARIENVKGLIAGTGSPNSHPAIVCRELKKPCIVGAKETVARLKDNEVIRMIVGAQIDENTVLRVKSPRSLS